MSAYDKVKWELPNSGGTFVAKGDLKVEITQTPQWLFNGLQEIFAAADELSGSSGALTEQVFQGAGSSVRAFNIEFVKWQGETGTSFGGADDDDDIIVKMQELDHALATTRITSDAPATLEFGEYSSAGKYNPVSVVPGEVTLPVDFSENTSSFRATVTWIDAVDLTQDIHT